MKNTWKASITLMCLAALACGGSDSEPTDPVNGGGDDVATAIGAVSGNGQRIAAGVQLPASLVVRVTNADNDPVSGERVTWAVTAGSGSLSSMSTVTDDDGRTSASWTLGPNVGGNSITASASGAEATANANGTQPVTVTVNMQGVAFVAPGGGDDITIMLGDTVRWVNLDAVNHTATSSAVPTGGDGFSSGLLGNGGEFSFVANVRGVWTYFCEVYPSIMRDALITVQ